MTELSSMATCGSGATSGAECATASTCNGASRHQTGGHKVGFLGGVMRVRCMTIVR